MKMIWIVPTSYLLTATSAFVQPSVSRGTALHVQQQHRFGITTKRYNARVDSADAVEAALEASKKYGANSKEAMILWDIVEEMDSSDNSAAYTGGISEEECLLGLDDPACQKYYSKLSTLNTILEENKYRMDNVKTLVSELQNIKLAAPKAARSSSEAEAAPIDTPAMQEALKEAKKATAEFGLSSTEAKLAWETLEEIAASNNSEAYMGSLEDECLIETIQACEAIEELSRAVNLLASDSRYQG